MKILTGFYNAEKYIERCLYTIQQQSYNDWTCYITHDMSTDNSVQLIKDFIKDDDRFILFDDYENKLYQKDGDWIVLTKPQSAQISVKKLTDLIMKASESA